MDSYKQAMFAQRYGSTMYGMYEGFLQYEYIIQDVEQLLTPQDLKFLADLRDKYSKTTQPSRQRWR